MSARATGPESGMEHGLRVVAVKADGTTVEVTQLRHRGRITIGRSPRNEIVVTDPSAPRSMTLLRLLDGNWALSTAATIDGEVWLETSGVEFTVDELRDATAHPGHGFARLDDRSYGILRCWGVAVMFQALLVPRPSPTVTTTRHGEFAHETAAEARP